MTWGCAFGSIGHCVENSSFPWNYVEVVHQDNKMENILNVSKVILHPLYESPKLQPVNYDIAILKLAAPIQTTKFFVCLPRNNQDQYVGQNITAIGWGITSYDTKVASKVLKATSFTVIHNFKCREAIEKHMNKIWKHIKPNNATHLYFKMFPFIICGESANIKSSTCAGDSGGRF